MSRSYLTAEPGRWRMFCDVCHDHDPRTFDTQPDLGIFHGEGWFIGARIDACPRCVTDGKLPADKPHRAYPWPNPYTDPVGLALVAKIHERKAATLAVGIDPGAPDSMVVFDTTTGRVVG